MVNIDDITVMAGLKQRMNYLTARQAVLAENIANANTPNYSPNDLKPINFSDEVKKANGKLALATTDKQHVSSVAASHRFALARNTESATFEMTPSGNAVVLEEEMLKMNQTASDYQATTALYRKLTNLMQIAIDGGN